MKRLVIIAIILIILGFAAFSWTKSKAAKQSAAVTTTQVKRTDFVKTVSSSGKVKADKSVDLKFQTSGRLAWVGVKEGDTVRAYQAIAGMDSREVQKTLQKYLIDYSAQRNTFEDTRKYDYPANKPEDALNDRMKHVLEANQWDLDKAVLDVELKHLAVEFATLVTPIAGLVTHVDTPVSGINITPATAVFSVADPTSLIFEASVDETEVGGLIMGQAADISLDAYPDASFSGVVSFISYISEQSSGGATVFPVKIAFTTAEKLRIGLNGDVSIETERQSSVLTVPQDAVREEKGSSYVYRKIGNDYEKVTVVIGAKSETHTVILEGLSDGDTVVTKGFSSIAK